MMAALENERTLTLKMSEVDALAGKNVK